MKGKNYERVFLFIACTVTLVWVIIIALQEIFPHRPAPAGVNSVMLIVAGGFFGAGAISNIRSSNNGDKNG